MNPIAAYLLNILIALDQLVNVVFFFGDSDETVSSVCFRAKLAGKWPGRCVPVVDLVFAIFQRDHCRLAYESEAARLQLPDEFRGRV